MFVSRRSLRLAALAAVLSATASAAEEPPPAVSQNSLAQMPVREITVFKDGHAFVLHEGKVATNDQGNVVLDYLPTPVLGTFWPYSSDKGVKLTSVTAGQRTVAVERTALDTRAMLEANIGARIVFKDYSTNTNVTGRIKAILERNSQELAETSPPNTPPQLPQKGNLLLLELDEGTRAIPIDRLPDVTFLDPPKTRGSSEEFRNLLTLRMAWPGGKPAAHANVGMAYLQRGIRWIPSYRIEIDGKGQARVQLQATLINELTDLEDVTAHLVIGVPTFFYKETVDPISLQQALTQLSAYFQDASQTQMMLSNSAMTQVGRMGDYRAVAPPPQSGGNLGPEIGQSGASEDLFLFTVEHLSLRKGERLVMPIVDYQLPYQDIYTLDLPYAPPREVRMAFDQRQQRHLAQLLSAPKAKHKLRLTNQSKYPLTTGPALILRDNRVLAQGMMTYTAKGQRTDLELTTAVEVQIRMSDIEVERLPNAATFNNTPVARANVEGKVCLVNFSDKPIEIEVTRLVLGEMDSADHDGKVDQANAQDSGWQEAGGDPEWWGWYNWPWWWHHFNGRGRAAWSTKIDAGGTVDLHYKWHYFWQ